MAKPGGHVWSDLPKDKPLFVDPRTNPSQKSELLVPPKPAVEAVESSQDAEGGSGESPTLEEWESTPDVVESRVTGSSSAQSAEESKRPRTLSPSGLRGAMEKRFAAQIQRKPEDDTVLQRRGRQMKAGPEGDAERSTASPSSRGLSLSSFKDLEAKRQRRLDFTQLETGNTPLATARSRPPRSKVADEASRASSKQSRASSMGTANSMDSENFWTARNLRSSYGEANSIPLLLHGEARRTTRSSKASGSRNLSLSRSVSLRSRFSDVTDPLLHSVELDSARSVSVLGSEVTYKSYGGSSEEENPFVEEMSSSARFVPKNEADHALARKAYEAVYNQAWDYEKDLYRRQRHSQERRRLFYEIRHDLKRSKSYDAPEYAAVRSHVFDELVPTAQGEVVRGGVTKAKLVDTESLVDAPPTEIPFAGRGARSASERAAAKAAAGEIHPSNELQTRPSPQAASQKSQRQYEKVLCKTKLGKPSEAKLKLDSETAGIPVNYNALARSPGEMGEALRNSLANTEINSETEDLMYHLREVSRLKFINRREEVPDITSLSSDSDDDMIMLMREQLEEAAVMERRLSGHGHGQSPVGNFLKGIGSFWGGTADEKNDKDEAAEEREAAAEANLNASGFATPNDSAYASAESAHASGAEGSSKQSVVDPTPASPLPALPGGGHARSAAHPHGVPAVEGLTPLDKHITTLKELLEIPEDTEITIVAKGSKQVTFSPATATTIPAESPSEGLVDSPAPSSVLPAEVYPSDLGPSEPTNSQGSIPRGKASSSSMQVVPQDAESQMTSNVTSFSGLSGLSSKASSVPSEELHAERLPHGGEPSRNAQTGSSNSVQNSKLVSTSLEAGAEELPRGRQLRYTNGLSEFSVGDSTFPSKDTLDTEDLENVMLLQQVSKESTQHKSEGPSDDEGEIPAAREYVQIRYSVQRAPETNGLEEEKDEQWPSDSDSSLPLQSFAGTDASSRKPHADLKLVIYEDDVEEVMMKKYMRRAAVRDACAAQTRGAESVMTRRQFFVPNQKMGLSPAGHAPVVRRDGRSSPHGIGKNVSSPGLILSPQASKTSPTAAGSNVIFGLRQHASGSSVNLRPSLQKSEIVKETTPNLSKEAQEELEENELRRAISQSVHNAEVEQEGVHIHDFIAEQKVEPRVSKDGKTFLTNSNTLAPVLPVMGRESFTAEVPSSKRNISLSKRPARTGPPGAATPDPSVTSASSYPQTQTYTRSTIGGAPTAVSTSNPALQTGAYQTFKLKRPAGVEARGGGSPRDFSREKAPATGNYWVFAEGAANDGGLLGSARGSGLGSSARGVRFVTTTQPEESPSASGTAASSSAAQSLGPSNARATPTAPVVPNLRSEIQAGLRSSLARQDLPAPVIPQLRVASASPERTVEGRHNFEIPPNSDRTSSSSDSICAGSSVESETNLSDALPPARSTPSDSVFGYKKTKKTLLDGWDSEVGEADVFRY